MKIAFALMLGAVMVTGCAKKQPTPSNDFGSAPAVRTAAPASSPEALRDALLQADPTLKVGIINQVDSRAMTAAMGGLNDADFTMGDVVSINDLTQQPVATGEVTASAGGTVTVRYTVLSGGRPPRDGDVALKFAR